MKKIVSVIIAVLCVICLLAPAMTAGAAGVTMPALQYCAHVSDIGWMKSVSYGETAGVTYGQHQLEALRISVSPLYDLNIKYAVHVSDIGWMAEVSKNELAGTTGQFKKIEAVYMYLTGTDADRFDIWYRVYERDKGWMGWTRNGDPAGSTGINGMLQSVQIKITEKNTFFPLDNPSCYTEASGAQYSSHVSDIGWMNTVRDGATSGKISGNHQIEAVRISSNIAGVGTGYATYSSKHGWSEERYNGQTAGTTGKAEAAEAVYIYIFGKNSSSYNIYYRAYVKDGGWTGWAQNGQTCGTYGTGKQLQGIEVKIIKKGESIGDGSSPVGNAKGVYTSSHVSGGAWQNYRPDAFTSGQIGGDSTLDSVRMYVNGVSGVRIGYAAYISGKGWATERYNGQPSGNAGSKEPITGIYAYIYGENAPQYELWYRVYIKDSGWLGWANGNSAGSMSNGYPIQALEVKLVKRGVFKADTSKAKYPSDNSKAGITYSVTSVSGNVSNTVSGGSELSSVDGKGINEIKINTTGVSQKEIYYTAHISDVGWVRGVNGGEKSGTGDLRAVEAIKICLTGSLKKTHNIYYRTYVSGKGWTGWATDYSACGSTGMAKPITKIEIRLLKKGDSSAPKTGNTLFTVSNTVVSKVSFAIDAGHGGNDPGATGVDGRYEKNDTIKVANEVIRLLKAQGHDAYLLDRNLKAEQRPKSANSLNSDFLVSIHRDSSSSSSASGISIYVHEQSHKQQVLEPNKEYAPAEQGDKHALDTKLANELRSNLSSVGGMGIRGIYYGSAVPPTYQDYYINRLANMPSCLIELGFLTNRSDNAAFDRYYAQYALAIAKSLMSAAGLTYK